MANGVLNGNFTLGGFFKFLMIIIVLGGIMGSYYGGIINTNGAIAELELDVNKEFATKNDIKDIEKDIGDIKDKVDAMKDEQTEQRVILEFIKDALEK